MKFSYQLQQIKRQIQASFGGINQGGWLLPDGTEIAAPLIQKKGQKVGMAEHNKLALRIIEANSEAFQLPEQLNPENYWKYALANDWIHILAIVQGDVRVLAFMGKEKVLSQQRLKLEEIAKRFPEITEVILITITISNWEITSEHPTRLKINQFLQGSTRFKEEHPLSTVQKFRQLGQQADLE